MANDEVYEVESLRAHRLSVRDNNKTFEYLIKWKDYGEEHNTWERERNIFAKGLISNYWRQQNSPAKTSKAESTLHAKLSAKPPDNQTWEDVEYIENVYFCRTDTIIFAEIKWKDNNQANTLVPSRIIRQKIPLKLIEYYQKKIEYRM